MTRKRDNKGRFVAKDSLASFTTELAGRLAFTGYRDGPFTGYAKDGNAINDYYQSSWLAKTAVERIPEDCFKKGYTWIAEATQISRIEAEEKRLQIKSKKKLALALSRKDGEAYLYFDTGQPIEDELRIDRVGVRGLRFVNVLRKSELSKGNRIQDPMSPFHGQPEYYQINSARIHPSRVIRFVRNENVESGDGVSDLVHLLGPIVAAETARDNTVALTTEALIDIMEVEGLMDAVSDPELEADVVKRYALFRQMKATNRMGVIDMTREKYSRHPSTFTTLPDIIETMRREVAAALEIPYALLFGRQGGIGTNGETDLATYYDSIATIQKNDIQPTCEPLDECIIRSALGNRPPEIYLEWLALWEMSDKERAEIAKSTAESAKTLADGGIIPAEVLTRSTVNALTENGSFPGLEQDYADWQDGGGWDSEEPDDELPGDPLPVDDQENP